MQELVDDFICALRRKVLYQGRMYIYEHHLCFYSKIFGHQKIVTIPLKVSLLPDFFQKRHLGELQLTVASAHYLSEHEILPLLRAAGMRAAAVVCPISFHAWQEDAPSALAV